MRYVHPSFGDLKSSPSKDRFRKALTSKWDSSARNQSISKFKATVSDFTPRTRLTCGMLTRFAGFVLSFSKIFCDWVFEANAAMFAVLREAYKGDFLGCKRWSGATVAGLLFGMSRWNLCRGERSGPDCD